MSWLQSHQSLRDHPKTKRAARLLGVSIPATIGHLHCLWYWAMDYAPDGDITRYESWEIAEAAMWEGDADTFVNALVECSSNGCPGFIEAGDQVLIHDWYQYAGLLIERRQQAAERMRLRRSANVQRTCSERSGLEEREERDKKEEIRARATPPVDNSPVDNSLVTLALTELPTSESTKEDYKRTIDRYRAKLSDEHIERIIYDLAAKPKYHDPKKKLHATLAAWLNKEPRDALRPEHREFKPAAEQTPAEREAAKVAAKEAVERVRAMTGQQIGRPL